MMKCKGINKEGKPGTEWVSLWGLAPFSGEALPDVDEALGWAWGVPALLSVFTAELFGALEPAVDVQLGGDVLGRAPGFGFFSWSLDPWELLGPAALATSRLAPVAPVPLTTGAAADAAFAFDATLRSPGFFTAFALDVWPSPALFADPSPSDFMADAALRQDVMFSDTLLVLCTGGLSGAGGGHFIVLDCWIKKNYLSHINNQNAIMKMWSKSEANQKKSCLHHLKIYTTQSSEIYSQTLYFQVLANGKKKSCFFLVPQ